MKSAIAVEVKQEILEKVKSGEKVPALGKQYGMSEKTIYYWLRVRAIGTVSLLEHQKLKKESQQLKEIIGILTFKIEKSKKERLVHLSGSVSLIFLSLCLQVCLIFRDVSCTKSRGKQSRKRIDITYQNAAKNGFFEFLVNNNIPCPFVICECKNYSEDPKNPELDQLSGRFSPRRGRFGILICRKVEDKSLMAKRCKDMADDDRGFYNCTR